MSILQKLKEISWLRNNKRKKEELKEATSDAPAAVDRQEEAVEEEEDSRVFDIPKKSRPPSIFIQLGSYDVVPPEKGPSSSSRNNKTRKRQSDKTTKALEEAKDDEDYEALLLKAWEASVDDTDIRNAPTFYEEEEDDVDSFASEEDEGDRKHRLALKKVAVRQSRILSVLSYQAREIARAREERRPVSLLITPTKSAMKRNSGDEQMRAAKERRSLTIVDPRDPLNPHPVICRKDFLEELRAQNRLSFDSTDYTQSAQPTNEKEEESESEDEDRPK